MKYSIAICDDARKDRELLRGFLGRWAGIAVLSPTTAIYIRHRLSSCKFCDEITVFHQGQVIQQGSHEELLAEERGKYHELWQAQAQYYAG